jgi:hypothetical protein
MKHLLIVVFSIILSLTIQAQDTTDVPKYWSKGATFGIQFTQSSFYQWTAGGENAITLAGLSKMYANYSKDKVAWDNDLDINYGVISQNNSAFEKNDDRFELNSAYGYQASRKWYYTGSVNFRSQFAPGYNGEDEERTKISNLLSPGYITMALGMNYKPYNNYSFTFSPIAGKTTIVLDEDLNAVGAFGVDPGKSVRYEFGGLFRGALKQNIMKNVTLETKLQLFSNYLENPQNIDVNWDALITFKVNEYINFNILAVLIYDHDILVPKDTNGDNVTDYSGRGVQFKEVLGLGLSYKL